MGDRDPQGSLGQGTRWGQSQQSWHVSPSSLRPSFAKLEQWLETLRMHLEIHLPLSSQLEQLDRAFGEMHRRDGGLPMPPR